MSERAGQGVGRGGGRGGQRRGAGGGSARGAPPAAPRALPAAAAETLADRLHSAAVHLLRRLRVSDSASGLTAPRLSALSVLVFGGPCTLGELAAAEQVRPPTITKLVRELETAGLVERATDPDDRRVQRVRATATGRALLLAGRRRRVSELARALRGLGRAEQALLARAAPLLERLARPPERPAEGVAALRGHAPRGQERSNTHTPTPRRR